MLDGEPGPLAIAAGSRGIVTIQKYNNVIDVSHNGMDPLNQELRWLLELELQYRYVERRYGQAAYDQETGQRRSVVTYERMMYRYDAYGRLVTNFGFYRRIADVCRKAGWTVVGRDFYPDEQRVDPTVYVPDWQNVLSHFQFRPRQDVCLAAIAQSRCGLVHAVTGFGKMAMLTMICLLYPKAKIDVVTYSAGLVRKIRQYLTKYLPNVGQVGAGKNKPGDRITVYTRDSLHRSDKSADFLLCDEAHLCLSDGGSSELALYEKSRNFALTATPTGRPDGTDKRLEALFGQSIFYLPYDEAVALGLVVPIQVEWADVYMDFNPIEGLQDDVARKRYGYWINHARNDVVARQARKFADQGNQTLILVNTVEHAVHLKKRLPDFTLVYETMEMRDRIDYTDQGFISADEPRMTPALREHYREEFEKGRIEKAISTVWGTGIDATGLGVVVRAAGDSSEQRDQQEPGRAARKPADEDSTKTFGIVCDFLDQFDKSTGRRASGRKTTYRKMGWRNYVIRNGVEHSLD